MKIDKDLQICNLLKSDGLYCTKHRVTILKLFYQASEPLSQNQIARRLDGRHLDKVTIYRTLESLVKSGLVHKAFISKRASYYELAHNCSQNQCHPHFICTNCGETFCLKDAFLPLIKGLKKGFVIQRQQVRIEGLCSLCS
jgi:Fur family transcriptional regulator, ferric uptake regulator